LFEKLLADLCGFLADQPLQLYLRETGRTDAALSDVVSTMRYIVDKEGFASLWRGIWVHLFRNAPVQLISSATTPTIWSLLGMDPAKNSYWMRFGKTIVGGSSRIEPARRCEACLMFFS
jgi:hypothetical protein